MRGRAFELRGVVRAAEAVGWVVGVIAVGSVLVALVAVALGVSERVGFGPWGAICIFVCAAVAGLLAWRRGARPAGATREMPVVAHAGAARAFTGRHPTADVTVVVTEVPRDLVGPVARIRQGRTAARPPADAGPSRVEYYAAMDERRPAEARRIVEALRVAGEDDRWCDNALRRIQFLPPGR